jgi:sterol desaturase/sphingolipid hydroxylase (fatty acid hydroxylase superfamily)
MYKAHDGINILAADVMYYTIIIVLLNLYYLSLTVFTKFVNVCLPAVRRANARQAALSYLVVHIAHDFGVVTS